MIGVARGSQRGYAPPPGFGFGPGRRVIGALTIGMSSPVASAKPRGAGRSPCLVPRPSAAAARLGLGRRRRLAAAGAIETRGHLRSAPFVLGTFRRSLRQVAGPAARLLGTAAAQQRKSDKSEHHRSHVVPPLNRPERIMPVGQECEAEAKLPILTTIDIGLCSVAAAPRIPAMAIDRRFGPFAG